MWCVGAPSLGSFPRKSVKLNRKNNRKPARAPCYSAETDPGSPSSFCPPRIVAQCPPSEDSPGPFSDSGYASLRHALETGPGPPQGDGTDGGRIQGAATVARDASILRRPRYCAAATPTGPLSPGFGPFLSPRQTKEEGTALVGGFESALGWCVAGPPAGQPPGHSQTAIDAAYQSAL